MKIQVIGAPGSGKSTLAEHIHRVTGVHWIDTDRYLWKDESFSEQRPIEERYKLYNDDVAKHKEHIVSGSVHSWNPQGFADRELLVLLLLDDDIRMKRLWDREYARFGSRMLPGGDHYKLTREFLDWCLTYRTADEKAINSLACHRLLLKQASCKTLVLDANNPPETLCETVLRAYRDISPIT